MDEKEAKEIQEMFKKFAETDWTEVVAGMNSARAALDDFVKEFQVVLPEIALKFQIMADKNAAAYDAIGKSLARLLPKE